MREPRSVGLTQWLRDVATAESDSLAPYRDRIMLSMGFVTALLLVPFLVNNFIQGRIVVALLLVLIELLILVDSYALLQSRSPPIPFALLLFPFIAGITAAVVTQGMPGILWSFPVMVFAYFVLARRMATVCTAAIILHVTVLALVYIDQASALRLFGSLTLTVIMINIVLNVISDLHRTLADQALTDPLTGAFNRRYMEQSLEAVVARAQRAAIEASVLLFDIDHFKEINDHFGHDKGDRALQQVVELIVARRRLGDKLFRWGGEEFLLLLEDTDIAGAVSLAQDLCTNIAATDIIPGRRITVSIGACQLAAGQSAEDWTKAADLALYAAKAAGRNQVARAEPMEGEDKPAAHHGTDSASQPIKDE